MSSVISPICCRNSSRALAMVAVGFKRSWSILIARRAQALADVIVELASDAASFLFLRVDEPSGKIIQLLFGLLSLADLCL
jgi:hypothetical protein